MKKSVVVMLLFALVCAPLLGAVGYIKSGNNIVFVFNGVGAEGKIRMVNVAGSFNGWKPELAAWRMAKQGRNWVLGISKAAIKRGPKGTSGKYEFKFVVNKTQWVMPPKTSPNKAEDGYGGINLVILDADLR